MIAIIVFLASFSSFFRLFFPIR